MSESNVRKVAQARPKRPQRREVNDLLGSGDGTAAVDASYGDTLRELLPRRLSALRRTRPRAS